MTPRACRLLPCLLLVAALCPATAMSDPVEIRVFWTYRGEEFPVMSRVAVAGTGIWRETDTEGRATLEPARCDGTVMIEVDRLSEIYRDLRHPCDGSPLGIATRSTYSDTLTAFIGTGRLPSDVAARAERARLADLRGLYTQGDFGAAAKLAADLSYRLRAESGGFAQALSVVAMDAGYRALGIDPANPDAPLIALDPAQQNYVMTEAGATVWSRFATAAEISSPVPWSGEGLSRIATESEGPIPPDRLIAPGSEDALRALQFDGSGTVGLGSWN